jgi:hypothetical protein
LLTTAFAEWQAELLRLEGIRPPAHPPDLGLISKNA